jgi:hypothetical protein
MYFKYVSSWSAVGLQIDMCELLILIFDVPYYNRQTDRQTEREREIPPNDR